MVIRLIITPLNGIVGATAALETALLVGKHLDAHVEAFHVSLDPRDSVAYMAEGMTSNMIQDVMTAVENEGSERIARARQQFQAASAAVQAPVTEHRASGGFAASFGHAVGREDDLIAIRGRLSDLIVAGRASDQDSAARTTLEIALLETGRPVLVAPPTAVTDFGKTVAIGWNGSAEASRAIGAGLQFLTEAEKVVVLVVPEGARSGVPVEDLLVYLACHGIEAEASHIEERDSKVGTALLEELDRADADLLIMGAYTHSRLRHLIFGGATSAVLTNAEIPVLMAH